MATLPWWMGLRPEALMLLWRRIHLKNKTGLERYGHGQKKIKKQRQQFEGFIFFFSSAAIGTYGNSMRAPFWFMVDILFNWILQENCFHYCKVDLPSCKVGGGIKCFDSSSFGSDTWGMNNSLVYKSACLAATDMNCQDVSEQKKWRVKANLHFS